MKLVATISCLLGLVLSQSQAQIHDDLCLLGPNHGGGQYEYKGVDADGKPYYQQKICQRTYEDGGIVKMAGSSILSFVKEKNKYFISRTVGVRIYDETPFKDLDLKEGDLYEINCETPGINSPHDCKKWTQNEVSNYIFGVHRGNCPDVLGQDGGFTGINVEFPMQYHEYDGGINTEDALLFNGDYHKIGLNMFKKAVSTLSNPIYLYFSSYYLQWRFIGSTSLDEKTWVGDDPDHFTCPAYSRFNAPYSESLTRGGFARLFNINEVFQQFNEDIQSYQVPLPYWYPNDIFDPSVVATEFITLSAIKDTRRR
mmetsp:Transcript_66198/g.59419  ORF Transcript_66198/g.59419 Transcript_66198/m.59419 type:complete len:312 (-) Transcript_66198:70-1005(-)